MDAWCVVLGIVALLLGVFIVGMFLGWWKTLFGLDSLSVCEKSSGAALTSSEPQRAARKSQEGIVKLVGVQRPRMDQVQAEAALMQARKASALNASALAQESRRARF